MPAANFDLGLELVPCADRNRLRKNLALPGLLGCSSVQRAVRAMFIAPGSEVVEPVLDALLSEVRQDEALTMREKSGIPPRSCRSDKGALTRAWTGMIPVFFIAVRNYRRNCVP